MFSAWQQHAPERAVRLGRSKTGCQTCKQRKVRCDEAQPKCGHCRRLRLDCAWRKTTLRASSSSKRQSTTASRARATSRPQYANDTGSPPTPATDGSPLPQPATNSETTFSETFDFASFLWDDTDLDYFASDSLQENRIPFTLGDVPVSQRIALYGTEAEVSSHAPQPESISHEYQLFSDFSMVRIPQILTTLETEYRWDAMKKTFMSLASTSPMLRYAIMALSALQFERSSDPLLRRYMHYYDESRQILRAICNPERDLSILSVHELQSTLSTLFLLTYIDLTTNRTLYAHENLRQAYSISSQLHVSALSTAERRILSWLRLLDGRLVSAGGEGLFLQEDDDGPANLDLRPPQDAAETPLDDMEGFLFEILCEPAHQFYQKVQSFMGRIAKIDLWHRTRGTVKDETEVMAIAAVIQEDLKAVYAERPKVMHLVAARRLLVAHLSPGLIATVTRSLDTYLANYHAEFIHLQRVAYRDLPRNAEVINAIVMIRALSKQMSAASGPTNTLPVNMLWPLLMWGCEEDDREERQWIIATIRNMQSSKTNAGVTADVLQEVQRRQDEQHRRADVRTVMHDIFKSCFAVV